MHIKKSVNFLFPLVVVASIYELLSLFKILDPMFFPSAFKILYHIKIELLKPEQTLIKEIGSSLGRFLFAFFVSIPLAIGLSLAISINKKIGNFFRPLIYIYYPVPKIAIYPLLLFVFGLGSFSKILLVFLSMFFVVTINSLLGFERIKSQGYLEIARFYKVNLRDLIFKVFIKGSYSEILDGIKLASGSELIMIVASESLISQDGLGHLVWNGWDQFNILDVYTGIIFVSIFGLVIFSLIDVIKVSLNRKFYGK